MVEYFNATDVLRYSNDRSERKKRLPDFWENSYIQEHLSNLESRGILEPYKTRRGKGGCTMMRNELFPLFLNWISPELLYDYKRKYPEEYDNYLKSIQISKTTTFKKKEHDFINVLSSLKYGEDTEIFTQFEVCGYFIDFAVKYSNDAFGVNYTFIEFDEEYHRYGNNPEEDKRRIDKISDFLKSNDDFDSAFFIRVPFDKVGLAYTYIIPYITGIETSITSTMIYKNFETYMIC